MPRKILAALLSTLLALGPTTSALAAPTNGTVSGEVTVEGRPLAGMSLALVDLDTGAIHRAKSDDSGHYQLDLAAGKYVVTSLSVAGLAVGKGPAVVVVAPGRVVVASLDLMRLPVVYGVYEPTPRDEPSPPPQGPQTWGNITHEPVGCFVAGQFPLLDALIQPPGSVARARVYFKSGLGPDYYFIEMTTSEGKFFGKLPKPKIEASPITYYIQATTTDFGENQTPEIDAIVVADESECPQGVKVAPIGPPGAVTVFSATTAAITVPIGFATAGLALGTGAIIAGLILLAIGTGVAVAVGGNDASPTPLPTPIATPTPTPSPVATPTPTPAPPFVCNICNDVAIDGTPDNCPCNNNLPDEATCGISGTPPIGYALQTCQMAGKDFTPTCGAGTTARMPCPTKD